MGTKKPIPEPSTALTITTTDGKISLSGSFRGGGDAGLFDTLIKATSGGTAEIDLSGLESIDTLGVTLLWAVVEAGAKAGKKVSLANAPEHIASSLEKFKPPPPPPEDGSKQAGLFESVGDGMYKAYQTSIDLLLLISEAVYWSVVGIFDHRGHRKGAVPAQAMAIGVRALPVLLLVAFLIGVVLALQSASQLRQFGANIFVANLLCISMAREMGPLMTAIILAGRSGASIAAEISSMTVSEETDALTTMGIKPIRYIVVPKVLGILMTAPLLSFLATMIGIFGGFLVAITTLELTPTSFYNQAVDSLYLKDIVTGTVKSWTFSVLIVVLASHFGFTVKGGPEGVGRATTNAVVASIFAVIVADAILGLLFY